MPKLTPSEFAAKWGRNLSAAASDIVAGAEKVTESPGKLAAANRDVWVAKMTSQTVHDKWAKQVGNVTLEQWKSAMRELVPSRLPGGVAKAEGDVADFASKLLPYQEANLGKIKSIKKVTLADSKRRMDEWFDVMSKFRYR